METKLSHEASLKVITDIITTAKGNIQQGAFHMKLWGTVIMLVSLSHFMLVKFQLIDHPEMVWLLMIPTFLVSFIKGFVTSKKAVVRTHIDTMYKWIWISLSIVMSMLIFFLYGNWHLISPMVLLIAGYATFLSGKLIKFKPMVYGGLSFWVWAMVAYFVEPYYGLLLTSGGVFTGYLIPGIMLQDKKNDTKTA